MMPALYLSLATIAYRMADSEKAPGLLANILAVAGFIILIVIIVWGAYHLLRLTGSGVTSLFSRFTNGNEITITVPATVESGASLPISWEYEREGDGSFALLYQCKAGFRFELPTPSGSVAAIPCGNAFTVGDRTSLSVTPVLSGTSSADVPFTVIFMPAATSTNERPQGTATVRVNARGNGTATPSTPTPSQPTPSTPSSPVETGSPDLSVRVLSVGVIDDGGNYIQRAPMHAGEISAVKFDIANNGGASTGAWYFTVNLPMQGGYLYASPAQASLAPGAHIENILRFRPMQSGGGNLTITVDSTKAVSESNEGNNSTAIWVNASAYPMQYYPPAIF